jgi:hypothetical protein
MHIFGSVLTCTLCLSQHCPLIHAPPLAVIAVRMHCMPTLLIALTAGSRSIDRLVGSVENPRAGYAILHAPGLRAHPLYVYACFFVASVMRKGRGHLLLLPHTPRSSARCRGLSHLQCWGSASGRTTGAIPGGGTIGAEPPRSDGACSTSHPWRMRIFLMRCRKLPTA